MKGGVHRLWGGDDEGLKVVMVGGVVLQMWWYWSRSEREWEGGLV